MLYGFQLLSVTYNILLENIFCIMIVSLAAVNCNPSPLNAILIPATNVNDAFAMNNSLLSNGEWWILVQNSQANKAILACLLKSEFR